VIERAADTLLLLQFGWLVAVALLHVIIVIVVMLIVTINCTIDCIVMLCYLTQLVVTCHMLIELGERHSPPTSTTSSHDALQYVLCYVVLCVVCCVLCVV
jgi:hypothetical protein